MTTWSAVLFTTLMTLGLIGFTAEYTVYRGKSRNDLTPGAFTMVMCWIGATTIASGGAMLHQGDQSGWAVIGVFSPFAVVGLCMGISTTVDLINWIGGRRTA